MGGSPSRLLVHLPVLSHFAPEDGEMYLLVPAHPGCAGQSPESRKMVVCVCACVFHSLEFNKVALTVTVPSVL